MHSFKISEKENNLFRAKKNETGMAIKYSYIISVQIGALYSTKYIISF